VRWFSFCVIDKIGSMTKDNVHILTMLKKILLFVSISLILFGCDANVNEAQNNQTESVTNGNLSTSTNAYPSAAVNDPQTQTEAYPSSEDPNQPDILLALDGPIRANDTVISGVGPSGLVVYLLDVTFMGEPLGSAVVSEQGTFKVETDPLPAGIRVGLTADVTEIGLTEADIKPGGGEISIPRVGYFYDSIVVEP